MNTLPAELLDALRAQRVVPVHSLDEPQIAVFTARQLAQRGQRIQEFTLRSPNALQAIRAVIAQVPEVVVGIGSILEPSQLEEGARLGARFLVSPGATAALLETGAACAVPYIPGVATASECLMARSAGYRFLKFFPALWAGGPKALAALAAPMPDLRFMPTGGITSDTLDAWLDLNCVVCCGASASASPNPDAIGERLPS